jgi:hypothetical protein
VQRHWRQSIPIFSGLRSTLYHWGTFIEAENRNAPAIRIKATVNDSVNNFFPERKNPIKHSSCVLSNGFVFTNNNYM